jgi:hypothetical protein
MITRAAGRGTGLRLEPVEPVEVAVSTGAMIDHRMPSALQLLHWRADENGWNHLQFSWPQEVNFEWNIVPLNTDERRFDADGAPGAVGRFFL